LETPPASSHFDHKQRIHPPKSVAPAAATYEPNITTTPVITAPSPSLMDLFMLSMMQQQQQRFAFSSTPPPLQPQPAIAGSAPSPTKHKHHKVLLDEFCTHYLVPAVDQERLEKLEFRPGNNISKLEREDWQGQAGFSKLAWDRMLGKHAEFLNDVKLGVWA
jgi:hypothetical protein